MILLEILRQFKERHGFKVLLLNMQAGGALTSEFRKHCVAVVDDLRTWFNDSP